MIATVCMQQREGINALHGSDDRNDAALGGGCAAGTARRRATADLAADGRLRRPDRRGPHQLLLLGRAALLDRLLVLLAPADGKHLHRSTRPPSGLDEQGK